MVRLAQEEWGSGPRTVLLLHGMAGSARSWWQVGPSLASRGYRVIAFDLPGHGRSAPARHATPDFFVDAVAASAPAPLFLAIGHSMGGTILARAIAAGRLTPDAAVYVESPFSTAPLTITRSELRARYQQHKAIRTEQWYRTHRPEMEDGDIRAEADASRCWDVDTAASLSWNAAGRSCRPNPNIASLIIRADPSDVISEETAVVLRSHGFAVRSVPGAGHNVWPGRVSAFTNLITEWIAD